ncbi:MAG: 1-acyl-sn-glycerol-3-phosphate acyltransferase [Deltaproteobacteria bacterium]|nr:1-acyl-sn-glycerol-3-phosphate acyltransferase [Deltaproteobacteria bacterium]
MIEGLVAAALLGFARLLTGAQARWVGCAPLDRQRVYFANHASHADFVLLWSSLPPRLRRRTRPVAGADYWSRGALRRYLIHRVFRGVLVDRGPAQGDGQTADPLAPLVAALDEGASLILFPEGTRNTGDDLLPFKSGLYNLGLRRPEVDLVPVWMDNLARVMPKGEVLPVPLLCSITFGAPLAVEPGEDRRAFLDRAREAVRELRGT